jgi:hypothetical protein
MKQLENILTIDSGHTATLVKRNDKAAIYKRETAEGQFVSFEVFAIMTKDGSEIYPNQKAVQNRWCVCPMTEAKANTWFDRFVNGEVTIPNVDPVTGESIEKVDNRSLDELPDVNVSVDVPGTVKEDILTIQIVAGDDSIPEYTEPVPAVELPTVEESPVPAVELPTVEESPVPAVELPTVEEDPTAPDDVPVVEIPEAFEVTPTDDGGVAVTVAKVNKGVVTMVIPTGEFTQAEFAIANGLPERGVVWSKLDTLVKAGTITKWFGSNGKGRPKAFFTATATV